MTEEEAKELLITISYNLGNLTFKYINEKLGARMREAIEVLEKGTIRDMEEVEEIMNSDADAETKCKMISNILTAKPHYFDEQHESEE